MAENAHRLPTTKGGWYFYYKRKNYVVIKDGMIQAAKKGVKFGSIAGLYFGTEAYIDYLRGQIDFISTITASGFVGLGYGFSYGLSKRQAVRSARAFMLFGFASGILQDIMRYKRGNDIWYMKYFSK